MLIRKPMQTFWMGEVFIGHLLGDKNKKKGSKRYLMS